ncbi:hypothetical protein ABIF90_007287 [Bradyrhizobium japonicum]
MIPARRKRRHVFFVAPIVREIHHCPLRWARPFITCIAVLA